MLTRTWIRSFRCCFAMATPEGSGQLRTLMLCHSPAIVVHVFDAIRL